MLASLWTGLVAGLGISVDDVIVAAVQLLGPNKRKVVGVGYFAHELPLVLAVLLLFLQALAAFGIGFVFALVDQLLNFLVFLAGVLVGKRLVVFGDQLLHLLTINIQDIRGFSLG